MVAGSSHPWHCGRCSFGHWSSDICGFERFVVGWFSAYGDLTSRIREDRCNTATLVSLVMQKVEKVEKTNHFL